MIAAPIMLMIALIPVVTNDFLLAGIYLCIIAVAAARYTKQDFTFLIFGFFAMFVSEYFFIMTGVETFERDSLFGIMPLWLPILWAYVFVAVRRSVLLFEKLWR